MLNSHIYHFSQYTFYSCIIQICINCLEDSVLKLKGVCDQKQFKWQLELWLMITVLSKALDEILIFFIDGTSKTSGSS